MPEEKLELMDWIEKCCLAKDSRRRLLKNRWSLRAAAIYILRVMSVANTRERSVAYSSIHVNEVWHIR